MSFSGLSPRGRGNRVTYIAPPALLGSIPAWAGEPLRSPATCRGYEVYPRVGGGTDCIAKANEIFGGLSPRGRGNRGLRPGRGLAGGSIPAWAGEPPSSNRPSSASTVYPRVGGGTRTSHRGDFKYPGLSPRGRGNPVQPAGGVSTLGSIPAWAGEPPLAYSSTHAARVYPRVGGGTLMDVFAGPWNRGLSPRGRGNRLRLGCERAGMGSIPAWAGEPCWRRSPCSDSRVYPRVGGGTISSVAPLPRASGLSPRGRGNRMALSAP